MPDATETTTLDLYTILDDRQQLAKLHAIQFANLAENEITGGDRPNGMRLSCADPIRRVKAVFEPFWALSLDDGIAARGHALEAYLEVALFHGTYAPLAGKQYESQVTVQWHEHGRTAHDFVVSNHMGADRVISCKSSKHGGKPSADNVNQERRMMALGGYPAGSVFEVWVLNPGTMRAEGPFEYALEQEHIDAARAELAGVSKAYAHFASLPDPTGSPDWNDPVAWRNAFGLESTSGAFRYTSLDASGAIESRNRAYLRAKAKADEAKRELDTAKDLIRTHVVEQIAAARTAGEQCKSVVAYSGDELAVYTLASNGAMRVTVKPLEAAQNAA